MNAAPPSLSLSLSLSCASTISHVQCACELYSVFEHLMVQKEKHAHSVSFLLPLSQRRANLGFKFTPNLQQIIFYILLFCIGLIKLSYDIIVDIGRYIIGQMLDCYVFLR